MKVFVALIIAIALPLGLFSQNPPPVAPPGQAPATQAPPAPGTNPLVDYTRQIKYEGLTLSIVLINDRTVEVLFQAPMKYSMRARAKQQTLFYVQGTPQKDFDLTNNFSIEQDGQTMTGTSTSIKNFVNGKVAKGERIDGIVEFSKKVDIEKPFMVKNGKGEVEFVLTPEAIKALSPGGQQ